MEIQKKIKPIIVKGIGKRGKNPHVNFNPGETSSERGVQKESVLTEQPVKVKAKSSRTGRTITHRFSSPEEAAKHYHKWLVSGRLKEVQLATENVELKLQEIAEEYDIDLEIIESVYARSSDEYPVESNLTMEQWSFAGVNSFVQGGRAFDLNEDLINEAAKPYKITAKTSNKSLGKLASRKDALGKQAKKELAKRIASEKSKVYGNKNVASKKLQSALTGKSKITPAVAKKIIATLGMNPKTAVAKSLTRVAIKHAEKKKIEKEVAKKIKSVEYRKQQSAAAKQSTRQEKADRAHAEQMAKISQAVSHQMSRLMDQKRESGRPNPEQSTRKLYAHEKPVSNRHDINPDVPRIAAPEKKGILGTALKFFGKKKKEPSMSDDEFNSLLSKFKRE